MATTAGDEARGRKSGEDPVTLMTGELTDKPTVEAQRSVSSRWAKSIFSTAIAPEDDTGACLAAMRQGDITSFVKGCMTTQDLNSAHVARVKRLLERELDLEDLKNAQEEPEPHWLLDNQCYSLAVNIAIVSNAIQLGMCTRTRGKDMGWGKGWHDTCDGLDHTYLAIFTIEALLRLSVYRLGYFRYSWHWLDIVVLAIGYVELGIQGSLNLNSFRTLRVLRVVRLLRLLRLFKDLWVIIEGLLASLKPTLWICVLLCLQLYIFSLVCVDTIGSAGADIYPGYSYEESDILASSPVVSFNNFQYFGTLPRSMYTLFNVVIGAEWPEIGRAVWERQPVFFFFFALFIIATMFGLMNVLIGVIVDNTNVAKERLQQEDLARDKVRKARCLGQLCEFVFSLDRERDGTVTLADIQRGFAEKDVNPLLTMLDLPHSFSPEELFHLFNLNGGEDISDEEFVTQAYRMINGLQHYHTYQLLAGINEVKAQLQSSCARQDEAERRLQAVEADVSAMRQEARCFFERLSELISGTKEPAAASLSMPARDGPRRRPPEEPAAASPSMPARDGPRSRPPEDPAVATPALLLRPQQRRRPSEDRASSASPLAPAACSQAPPSGPPLRRRRQSEDIASPSASASAASAPRRRRWSDDLSTPSQAQALWQAGAAVGAALVAGESALRAAGQVDRPSRSAAVRYDEPPLSAFRAAARVDRPSRPAASLPDEPPPLLPNMCDSEEEPLADRRGLQWLR